MERGRNSTCGPPAVIQAAGEDTAATTSLEAAKEDKRVRECVVCQ